MAFYQSFNYVVDIQEEYMRLKGRKARVGIQDVVKDLLASKMCRCEEKSKWNRINLSPFRIFTN